MLLYLAGPMTLYKDSDWGASRFAAAAADLRAAGYDVISPAETAGGVTHLPRETYMRVDTSYVANCDAVVLLPRWEDSSGAKLEVAYAAQLGKEVYLYNPPVSRCGCGQPNCEYQPAERLYEACSYSPLGPEITGIELEVWYNDNF